MYIHVHKSVAIGSTMHNNYILLWANSVTILITVHVYIHTMKCTYMLWDKEACTCSTVALSPSPLSPSVSMSQHTQKKLQYATLQSWEWA